MFFDSLLYDATSEGTKSYNQMAIEVKSTHGVDISGQGIDQRFNNGAQKYIQGLIGEQLSSQVSQSIDIGWSKHFKRVIIKDSTKFDLPKTLWEKLPGFGGCASNAGVCIQYEFNVKSGEVNDLSIHPAKRPDNKDAMQTIDLVRSGDLTIRDLGYFVLDYFKRIEKVKAFFLSRLNTKILVYQKKEDKFQELDFVKVYQRMKARDLQRLDQKVYIGEKEKFPVRLIIELVPEEVVATRMQRVNKYNKKKGRQTGEEYKKRARFNLFITNITEEILNVEAIVKIYRIRWQIELIFKTWKSVFGLDNIGQMKYERLMCILNTRLLLILINWEIFMLERVYQHKQTGKLLSIHKSLQTLKDNSAKLRNILTNGCKGLAKWFRWVGETLSSKHWLERKKNKLGFEEILCSTILESNKYEYIYKKTARRPKSKISLFIN
jgi:hypothetical protein